MTKSIAERIKQTPNNETICYVVYGEHTLGYLFKNRLGELHLGSLHGKVLKNGLSDLDGPYPINQKQLKQMRLASEADFNDFRVSPRGYDLA